METIGRGAADGGGAHVLHQHYLLLGVARRCGQLHGAQLGSTIVGAQTAGEEAVAVAYLHHIAGAHITHSQHSGHALGPHVEVVLCVGAYHGLTCGAA